MTKMYITTPKTAMEACISSNMHEGVLENELPEMSERVVLFGVLRFDPMTWDFCL